LDKFLRYVKSFLFEISTEFIMLFHVFLSQSRNIGVWFSCAILF